MADFIHKFGGFYLPHACIKARSCSTKRVELARERKLRWRAVAWNKEDSTWWQKETNMREWQKEIIHLCQVEACQGE